jgi:hypothetical protein
VDFRRTEAELKKEVTELKEINKAQLEELSTIKEHQRLLTEGNCNSDCRFIYSVTCHELTAVGPCMCSQ